MDDIKYYVPIVLLRSLDCKYVLLHLITGISLGRGSFEILVLSFLQHGHVSNRAVVVVVIVCAGFGRSFVGLIGHNCDAMEYAGAHWAA